MAFIDFAELKQTTSMEKAISLLGLTVTKHGDQFRAPCPTCKQGGDRALVMTVSKKLFYCFAAKAGGDVIALAAHIRGCKLPEAAAFLGGTSTVPSTSNRTVPAPQAKSGFDPVAYASRLKVDDPCLAGLGLTEETLRAWPGGMCSSGPNRGRLALGVHSAGGEVVGFVGVAVEPSQQPAVIIPTQVDPMAIFGAHKLEGGELVLFRTPLDCLVAIQSGINGISFLTDAISTQQLASLLALMDEHGATHLVLP